MRTVRRGFTLVELLVVVGIIAVFIAALMPVLSKAREHANRVKCAANLRTMGQAMTAYVSASGYYPCAQLIDGSMPSRVFALWPTQIRQYMGGEQDPFNCPSRDERFEWQRGGFTRPGHLGARATAAHTPFGYEQGEPLLQTEGPGMYFSYGYNFRGSGLNAIEGPRLGLGYSIRLSNVVPDPASGQIRSSRVRKPSEMVAITDSNGDGLYDFLACPYPNPIWYPGPAHPVGKVHSGGANVLFCDGHVQWYLQKDLVISESDVNWERAAKARRWNNDHQGMPPFMP